MGGCQERDLARVVDLFLTSEAVADLRATREYYEAAEVGLSRRFLTALDELFSRLRTFPRSAPPVAGYENLHRAVVRGFPFVVFYRVHPERIDVLRVLHVARSDADRP
jgi:plasmid stabilization system protein ParE